MNTELLRVHPDYALPGGFELSPTGLVVSGTPSFEQWEMAGKFLQQAEGAVQWWLGDWLNYGERAYGEMYPQAIRESSGRTYQTLANCKWVAGRVQFSVRTENLSFTHHVRVASLEPAEQRLWLERASANGWSEAALRSELRLARNLGSEPPPTDPCSVTDLQELVERGARFGTIYADPPWQYGNQATRAATDNHYSTMTVEEIASLPVAQIAAPAAHLHLWTTNAFLFEARQVLEAWGFEYKSVFVWCKPIMGLGNYWRVSHEFMLLGVRGNLPFRDRGLMSWAAIDRGEHSVKPEKVRRMIEKASPGPRLELFGRHEADGWTVWGNQISRTMFDRAVPPDEDAAPELSLFTEEPAQEAV